MQLTCWFGLTSFTTQMSKEPICFSKAVFHTPVVAKKNFQTDSERSVGSVIWGIGPLANASVCELRGDTHVAAGVVNSQWDRWFMMLRVISVDEVLSLIGHESVWKKDSKYSLFWYLSLIDPSTDSFYFPTLQIQ